MLRLTDRAGLATTRRAIPALLMLSGLALPAWALPARTEPSAALADLSASLDRDHALRARAELDRLIADGAVQSAEAADLAARVQRLVSGLTSDELAVQRGELALASEDLRSARRHARSVINRGADADLTERARLVLDKAQRIADGVMPRVPAMLDAADTALARGNAPMARDILTRIDRLGLDLGLTLGDRLALAKDRVLNAELASGQTGRVVSASLVAQPEGEQPEGEQPLTDQPVDDAAGPDDIVDQAQRAAAQGKLAEADALWDEGRRRTAGSVYRELLDVYRPYLTQIQIDTASARLRQVGSLLDGNAQPLEEAIVNRDVQRQVARREFEAYLSDARQDLETGATESARINASQARLTLNRNRIVLAESEYQDRLAQVDALLSEIVQTEEQLRREQTELLNEQIAVETEEQEERRQRDRARRVNEALERARLLQAELKYEEAIEVVDQALFLDPTNPAALLIRDVLADIVVYDTFADLRKTKARKTANITLDLREAAIPPDDIVNYPPDWPTISFRRSEMAQLALSNEDQRVYAKLERDRIPVHFAENTLEEAVDFVREVAGVNVDVHWRSLEDIGVTRQTPVSLRLTDVPVKVVLDRIVAKTSDPVTPAGWAVRDGVVTVASQSLLDRDTETLVYDVRDLLIEVPDFGNFPNVDLADVIRATNSEDLSLASDPFSLEGEGGIRPTINDRPRVEQIMGIIRQNIDFDSWQSNGGTVGSIQDLGGQLVITNTPDNHRQVAGLLSRLREFRAMQINVEARFLTINQDFFEQLGFDVDVVFNAQNDQFRTVATQDPTIAPSNLFEFSNISDAGGANRNATSGAPPLPFIVTDAAGNPIQDNNGVFQTFTPPNAQGVPVPQSGFSPVPGNQNSLTLSESLLGGLVGEGFAADVLNNAPALGVAGRFLDDIQVDFLVKATQADQRSSTLTAPRLTFTNGQTSNIRFSTQQAFVSTLTPVVAPSAVAFTPTVGIVNEGVSLGVEGTISADRRYVTLSVDTSTNQVIGFEQQAVTALAGGEAVSSAEVASFIQLPIQTITRVQTTVTVPDQGTVLLGGQKILDEFEVETGVPVLSKIPLINRFFSNRIDSTEESTLLILIKPTILIQNEEEEKNFPGLLDSLRTNFGG